MFCNDRCWVEVTVDGEKVFEGTLVSNQEKNFSADKKIIVNMATSRQCRLLLTESLLQLKKLMELSLKNIRNNIGGYKS